MVSKENEAVRRRGRGKAHPSEPEYGLDGAGNSTAISCGSKRCNTLQCLGRWHHRWGYFSSQGGGGVGSAGAWCGAYLGMVIADAACSLHGHTHPRSRGAAERARDRT